MELGGVSVPGRSQRNDGAYLLKDLTVFETQLGGLKAFVMVSDGIGDDASGDAAAHLAVKAADSYLGSILLGIATGKTPVVDPTAALKAIVTRANTAIMSAPAEPGGPNIGATFVGAFVSAEKAWFGQIGQGRAYLLRGDEAHELVVSAPASADAVAEDAPADGQAPDHVPADNTPTALGHEGVDIEVGSVDLSHGDVVVLCGRAASAALSASDILGISCAACDAGVAAAGLADAAAKTDPDSSVTVALWSADSSLFTPVPPPPPPQAPPQGDVSPAPVGTIPIIAANNDASSGLRAERIFLWLMSAWIVIAFLALAGMALFAKPSTSATGAGGALDPSSQGAALATSAPEATAAVAPSGTTPAEFPKTLTVPKNVKGGLWLRKKASTAGGANRVVVLKGGAEVQAVDVVEGKDANGKTQQFYVFKVSEISAKQVVKTSSYPWPPPKSVKKVYAFAGSFD